MNIKYVHSELLEKDNYQNKLKGFDGILVAPGFGHRGIEGKLLAVRYARENDIPFFGICLGMQSAVIEFSRNVLGIADAHSAEMNKTKNPVIDLMEAQKKISNMGGTMRLGAFACTMERGSLSAKAYGRTQISERHRHRYELNDKYRAQLEKAGMKVTGTNPETGLAEIIEIPALKWFVGVQFHPELKSTVDNPHPLFVRFVRAAMESSSPKALPARG